MEPCSDVNVMPFDKPTQRALNRSGARYFANCLQSNFLDLRECERQGDANAAAQARNRIESNLSWLVGATDELSA